MNEELISVIVPLIPILVAVIAVAGTALTYVFQKGADRRNSLVELRRRCYRDYLLAYSAMSDAPERAEDLRRRYYQAEFDLLIVGSDEVVKAVGALSTFYASTNADRFNRDVVQVKLLVARVCQAMRKDCFERSDLTIDEIQKLIPIA